MAEIIALVLSRSLGLAGDPAREALIVTAYILIVSTPLLVTTRVSAFARTQWTRQALPKPSACEEIAVRYGHTPHERSILTILAEGHRQAFARNRRLDERVHDVAALAGGALLLRVPTFGYSLLSASTGSLSAAIRAGIAPPTSVRATLITTRAKAYRTGSCDTSTSPVMFSMMMLAGIVRM